MDELVLLIALEFAYYIYRFHLQSLNVVTLEYVITEENIEGSEIVINLDLNDSLQLRSPDYLILNPKINVRLPRTTFPDKQDYLGFDYDLRTLNQTTNIHNKENMIIRIQLFDTLVNSPLKIVN